MRRLSLSLCLVLAALSLSAAPALAVPPILDSVTLDAGGNHPTYAWRLPANVTSQFFQTSTSPEVDENGYFPTVVSFNTLGATQTTFFDEEEFSRGRIYYVHIAGHDSRCRGPGTCPSIEFSEVMSFVVGVPGVGPPPFPGALPSTTGGPGGDKVRPLQNLTFPPVQDVDKLFVRARMSEPGTLRASATVSVGGASKVYRFKTVSRKVEANVFTKIRLRLAKKNRKAVKRVLKRSKRIKAKIKVTAIDRAGNKRAQRATIRLTN